MLQVLQVIPVKYPETQAHKCGIKLCITLLPAFFVWTEELAEATSSTVKTVRACLVEAASTATYS